MVLSRTRAATVWAAAAALLVTLVPGAHAAPARPSLLGFEHYRGEFHSHTSISDGQLMPADAFRWVAEQTNADFFGLAEHDVAMDLRNADAFITDWRDAGSQEWRYLKTESDAFNAAQRDLVTLATEELTWYDGTGHMNVYNTDWMLTARSAKGGSWGTGDIKWDLPTVYARLGMDEGSIAQMNHPGATGWGDFDDFNHHTPEADEHVSLFEYKVKDYHSQWVLSLDNGWHLSPTYSGDEHRPTWVTSSAAITGIWAREHTREGLFDAMRNRRTYASFDDNAVLRFTANGQIMGSILPADTTTLDLDVTVEDPDSADAVERIQVYGNGGKVLKEVTGTATLRQELPSADGDYVFIKVTQRDGQEIISAPVWVGPKVRGANDAPVITVAGELPTTVSHGQEVVVPPVSATDDSGVAPTVSVQAWNAGGSLPVVDGRFRVEGYSDHFVTVRAVDKQGSTSVRLFRMVVDTSRLDPTAVFRMGGGAVNVGAQPGSVGLTALTDQQVEQVFAQVLPVGSQDWSAATTVHTSRSSLFEQDEVGVGTEYTQDALTGHTIRSHELDVAGLAPGQRYQYRFGVSADGGWTPAQGEFVAAAEGPAPVYVLGDLQVSSHNPDEWQLFNRTLEQLRAQRPGGDHVIQTGDLVDNGGRGEYWDEVQREVLSRLDLPLAQLAGNHETYGDKELGNVLSAERNRIMGGHVNLPDNGVVGEANYSYDRGDVHYSVLNSNYSLAEQLAWLVADVRASSKPWKVVLGHFSYYGGQHADDAGMAADRARVTDTLRQLGVHLYLGGHDHVYKRSTIVDGRLATTDAERAEGTTFITLGSAGPKFYQNQPFWWDDVVDDRDIQMGTVLDATADSLRVTTYTIDGEVVDDLTIGRPSGSWRVSSVDQTDDAVRGVGLLSHPGARDSVTVTVASYNYEQTRLLGMRSVEVPLDRSGTEQYVAFAEPLPTGRGDAVKLFVWDSPASAVPLQSATVVRRGFTGQGTEDHPFEIRNWDDMSAIDSAPDAHFRLAEDLVLDGQPRQQLGAKQPFRGVLDGAGHTISGFVPDPDGGAGLFVANEGTIRNLAFAGSDVETGRGTVGLLVDYHTGTIENVWTSGSIVGANRVGGIVGDSMGTIRDSYTTADVRARTHEAGGIAGVALAGSTTERVYATGNVRADEKNVGGIAGYGYDNTSIHSAVSLNESVTAPQWAHAVLGRVLTGEIADLEQLYASDLVFAAVKSAPEQPAADNLLGEVVPDAQLRNEDFFEGLGWDMRGVWQFDEDAGRPLLRTVRETWVPDVPALPVDDQGYFQVSTPEQLSLLTQYPRAKFALAADLDLSGLQGFQSLGGNAPFRGELDGRGHTIAGLTSTTGGLVNINLGHVHDLSVTGAVVTSGSGNVGLVANSNHGTIERVWGSGKASGPSRVGGLVGESQGIVRDAYAVVDVHADKTEAGGVVGVALGGSTTERVYARGTVHADGRNIGGVAGYGYNGTTLRHAVALNPTVSAPQWAHRVLGRVLAGNTATLSDNWALESVDAQVPALTDAPAAGNLHGATATLRQVRGEQFWARLGFELGTVWSWDDEAGRPVLRGLPERPVLAPLPQPAQPSLPKDADGAFLLSNAQDLAQIEQYPDLRYRLAGDLDLSGAPVRIAPTGFSGELDGAGHVVRGYRSDKGGLFGTVTGQVHDLGIVDAEVKVTTGNVGLLADINRGTLERVFSTGKVQGKETVGGLVGYHYGTLRDSYSTADVVASGGRQAGGLAGITGAGSLTERTYASGRVEVVGNQNAGGVSGYGYNGTVLRSSVALNPSVKGTAYAHRVMARELGGHKATLADNLALSSMAVSVVSVPAEGDATLQGRPVDRADLPAALTAIGWDLDQVWAWDGAAGRPVLRSTAEGK